MSTTPLEIKGSRAKGATDMGFRNIARNGFLPILANDLAVISDIHSNLHALDAVLADIQSRGISNLLCLGDIVGYGAQPAECVDRIRELGCTTIMGNHDSMVACGVDDFSERVRPGIEWSRQQLSADQKSWLASLPLSLESEDYQAVHASLWQPETWRYLITADEAQLHFRLQSKPACFIGHSHLPRLWVEGADERDETFGIEDVRKGKRHIVNAGSVGQPRDHEPMACYVIYSQARQEFRFQRVSYDVAGAQAAIIAAGLPASYARRLVMGR